jgi:hypothetical protein
MMEDACSWCMFVEGRCSSGSVEPCDASNVHAFIVAISSSFSARQKCQKLVIFPVSGREARTAPNRAKEAGRHSKKLRCHGAISSVNSVASAVSQYLGSMECRNRVGIKHYRAFERLVLLRRSTY